jgi:tRNA A37 threonylcarbamoyladenosine dehydratase
MGEKMNDTTEAFEPVPLDPAGLIKLRTDHPESRLIDEIGFNLEELFLLRNPKYRFDKNYHEALSSFRAGMDGPGFGNWFYFPWLNSAVRFLPEDLHLELRTGRNKLLITADEQAKFYSSVGAFLGMSVGSHAAIVVAMTGGMKRMKLVDPDKFSGDNLNRVRTGFQNVGVPKAVAVARQVYEINPYAQIDLYPEGLNVENASEILDDADILVEEMDNPFWKLRIRELARERKIPVLMATDNGDGVIVDVERYDTDKNPKILNGLIGKLTAEQLKTMKPQELPKVAGKIAGASLVVPRMLDSVAEVGKTLYSWPQLGTAANMCGSVIAALARRISNKNSNIRSGRYSVSPEAIFESDHRRKWFSRKIAFLRFVRKMSKL